MMLFSFFVFWIIFNIIIYTVLYRSDMDRMYFIGQLFLLSLLWILLAISSYLFDMIVVYILSFCILSLFITSLLYSYPLITNIITKLGERIYYYNNDKKYYSLKPSDADEIVKALFYLKQNKIGALIVFQNFECFSYTKSKVEIDAKISHELIESIFYPNNTLHDGALIIKDRKIKYAKAILPINNFKQIPNYGTRHIAAIEMNAKTNFPCIVLSEETQKFSVIYDKNIKAVKTKAELKEFISNILDLSH